MNPFEVTRLTQYPPRPSWLSTIAAAIMFGLIIATYGLFRWLGPDGLALNGIEHMRLVPLGEQADRSEIESGIKTAR